MGGDLWQVLGVPEILANSGNCQTSNWASQTQVYCYLYRYLVVVNLHYHNNIIFMMQNNKELMEQDPLKQSDYCYDYQDYCLIDMWLIIQIFDHLLDEFRLLGSDMGANLARWGIPSRSLILDTSCKCRENFNSGKFSISKVSKREFLTTFFTEVFFHPKLSPNPSNHYQTPVPRHSLLIRWRPLEHCHRASLLAITLLCFLAGSDSHYYTLKGSRVRKTSHVCRLRHPRPRNRKKTAAKRRSSWLLSRSYRQTT